MEKRELVCVLLTVLFTLPTSATVIDLTSGSKAVVNASGTFTSMGITNSDSDSGYYDVIDYKVGVNTSANEIWIEHLELQYNGTIEFEFPDFGSIIYVKDITIEIGPTGIVNYQYDSETGLYEFNICDVEINVIAEVDSGEGWEDFSDTIGGKIVDSAVLFDGNGDVQDVWTHFIGGWWEYDDGIFQMWNTQGLVTPEPMTIGLLLAGIIGIVRKRSI